MDFREADEVEIRRTGQTGWINSVNRAARRARVYLFDAEEEYEFPFSELVLLEPAEESYATRIS